MAGRTERAWRLWPAALGAAWLAFAGWLLTADTDARATNVVVNLVETGVPLAAGLACLQVSRQVTDAAATWALAGVGVLGWALGQLVWTWYEVVRQVEVPFPSLADVGYLAFPLFASIGVATYLTRHAGRRPLTAALDGTLVAASLFAISWFVLLQDLVASGGLSTFELLLSMAYPVADVIVVAMVLHAVSRLRQAPLSLWLLSAGLVVMGVADSAFVWMLESAAFSTGGWVDLAWISAFCLIGLAAWLARHEAPREVLSNEVSRTRLVLPYAVLTVGMAFIAANAWTGEIGRTGITVALLMVALVLWRQYLTLAENYTLMASLRDHEAELQHLALHDPLTGLANRALLADRLARTGRLTAPANLLLVDLDDFKVVNDVHGHAAGDALLITVSERLTAAVRASDTVARLGGDEFALLLDPASDNPDEVAQRVLGTLSKPIALAGYEVRISASVGVGRVPTQGTDAERSQRALHEADLAMYAAKAAGKNRWHRYLPGTASRPAGQKGHEWSAILPGQQVALAQPEPTS